jgi:proteasome lid subunit RPN8/RPN11
MSIFSSGISIRSELILQMKADVSARTPEEACGFVVGSQARAEIIIPVTNILHDPFRFRMDPQEELNAFLLAEKKGKEIIAVYHSHPYGIAHPSESDIKELTFPGVVYLIWFQLSESWQCRAYLMQANLDPVEIPLHITPNVER